MESFLLFLQKSPFNMLLFGLALASGAMLRKKGFADAFALRGGIAAWQQANLPLEKS